MSDPQQPPRPPYAANPPQPAQPGGYSTPPGAAPQRPYYAPQARPADASATNAPGRIGFIVGLVGLGIGLLSTAIVQIIVRSPLSAMDFNYALINTINGVGSFLAFAASLAALILGIVGLRKAGSPHAHAGIATGLGIAGVTGGVFTLILIATPFFY